MGQNFQNGAKIKKIRGARHMPVKCASSARQVRVNLVPESARHLQMTRTRHMRVMCVRVRVIYLRPNTGIIPSRSKGKLTFSQMCALDTFSGCQLASIL